MTEPDISVSLEFTKLRKDRIIKAGGNLKIRSRRFPTCFYRFVLSEIPYFFDMPIAFYKKGAAVGFDRRRSFK